MLSDLVPLPPQQVEPDSGSPHQAQSPHQAMATRRHTTAGAGAAGFGFEQQGGGAYPARRSLTLQSPPMKMARHLPMTTAPADEVQAAARGGARTTGVTSPRGGSSTGGGLGGGGGGALGGSMFSTGGAVQAPPGSPAASMLHHMEAMAAAQSPMDMDVEVPGPSPRRHVIGTIGPASGLARTGSSASGSSGGVGSPGMGGRRSLDLGVLASGAGAKAGVGSPGVVIGGQRRSSIDLGAPIVAAVRGLGKVVSGDMEVVQEQQK